MNFKIDLIKLQNLYEAVSSNLRHIGDCRNDDLIDDIFGSTSEFARLVEQYGDDFTYENIVVKYDPNEDIHYFFERS